MPDSPMTTLAAGSVLDVHAHGTALGGSAVARLPDGRVCFIPFAIPGEDLRIRLTAVKKSFAEAELVAVLAPSPDRVEPPCPVFGRCGGCQYQHVGYARQIALKSQQLRDTLRRIGGIAREDLDEVHAAPEPWAYRNRLGLHPGPDGLGLLARDQKTVIGLNFCPIAKAEVNAALPDAPRTPGARTITIRWSPGGGTVSYAGNAPADLPPCQEEVAGRAYTVPTGSFAQVNPAVADILFALVGRWVTPLAATRVIDAYCGAGFLGLAITDRPVVGLEIDARSIEAARGNAETRGLGASHTYHAGEVEALLDRHLTTEADTTVLILDPPRAGCAPGTIQTILKRLPGWILYVSCEPSTLARDLKLLTPAGYQISRTALLDMFPQTAHFETAVLLTR